MNSGMVTAVKKTINVVSSEPINFYIFSDIHFDSETCDKDLFLKDLKKAKKDKKSYCLFLGDVLDFVAIRDLKKIKNSNLHDNSMLKIDDFVRDDIRKFYNEIKELKGRVIGMIGGNHDWCFEDGKTGTEKLCEMMNCSYLGWISYISIKIHKTGRATKLDIVACHGKAGGKLPGTSINQVEDLWRIFPDADIYLMGHDHKRGVFTSSKLYADSLSKDGELRIRSKTQYLCRAGSYQKAYEKNKGGYISRTVKSPSSLGNIMFSLLLPRKTKDGKIFFEKQIRFYV